jgi:hypothetical protein
MLAYPLDDGRLSMLGKHFLMQPKLRGERVIVEWFAGEAVLISSYGNEFKFMEHITSALKPLYDQFGPIPFDGEIYKHGWSQDWRGAARRGMAGQAWIGAECRGPARQGRRGRTRKVMVRQGRQANNAKKNTKTMRPSMVSQVRNGL